METQRIITAMARGTDECLRHGDIIRCSPVGGYAVARTYRVEFDDGHVADFWLKAGKPVRLEIGK